MIKNGRNGSFQVVFPLVRLVSSLRGFNSSGLTLKLALMILGHKGAKELLPINFIESEACKSDEDTLGTINEVYKLKILDVGAIRSRLKLRCLSCAARVSSTNYVNPASTPVNTASPLGNVSAAGPSYPDLTSYADEDDS
ncbi:hypothetical protein Tco_0158331 [Tanacetum coccineum]